MAEQTSSVRGVIFDWGGVITTPIADTVTAWLSDERIDRDSYAAAMRPWVRHAYGDGGSESPIHGLERGEVTEAEFELALAALLVTIDGEPVAASGLLRRMFGGQSVQDEMLDLIRDLRGAGLRTGLLSNSWGLGQAYPWQLLEDLFDDVVISGQVGMRKPEQRIFTLAAAGLGLRPQECVFIDDVEGNIVAARDLGFATVHHSEPAQTRSALRELLPGLAALAGPDAAAAVG